MSFTFSTVAMDYSLTVMPFDAAASDSPSGENAIECGFEQDGGWASLVNEVLGSNGGNGTVICVGVLAGVAAYI